MSKLRYESFVSYRSMDYLLNEEIDDDIIEIKHLSETERETGWDEYDIWISTMYQAGILYKEIY